MAEFKGENFIRPGTEKEYNPTKRDIGLEGEGQITLEKPMTTEELNAKIVKMEKEIGFTISPKLQEMQRVLNSERRTLDRHGKRFGVDLNMPTADLKGKDHFDTMIEGDSLKDLRNLELMEAFKHYSDDEPDVDPVIKRIVEKVRREGVTVNNEKELLPYFQDIGENAKEDEYVLFLIEQNGRRDLVPIDKLGRHGGQVEITDSLRESYDDMSGYERIHNHSDYTHQDVVKMLSKYYGEEVRIQGDKAGPLAPSITDLHAHLEQHIRMGGEITFKDRVITSDGIWTVTADKESHWYKGLDRFNKYDKTIRSEARKHFKEGTTPNENIGHEKYKETTDAIEVLYGLDMKKANVLEMYEYYDVKADLFLGDTKGQSGIDKVTAAAKNEGFNLTFEQYE